MPDLTIASAMPRTSSSLTLQANLFQVFQPIGGVRARPLDTSDCANETAVSSEHKAARRKESFFIVVSSDSTQFYQKNGRRNSKPLSKEREVGRRAKFKGCRAGQKPIKSK